MVILIMGAPRAKNGSHISRPIIFMERYVTYPSVNELISNTPRYATPYSSAFGDSVSTSSVTNEWGQASNVHRKKVFFSSRRESSSENANGNETTYFAEIKRQKEVMLRASITKLEDKIDYLMQEKSTDEFEFNSTEPNSLVSSWRGMPRKASSHNAFLVSSHIHESRQKILVSPCRNDLLYATECNISPFTPLIFKSVTILLPRPPSPLHVWWELQWGEWRQRAELMRREERFRRRLRGAEVGDFLSQQRADRRRAKQHGTTALARVQRKERRCVMDGFARRAEREGAEHRGVMRGIPAERLPPLRIPSLTPSGRVYRNTNVDTEVARALAVEERLLREVTAEKHRMFFPSIL